MEHRDASYEEKSYSRREVLRLVGSISMASLFAGLPAAAGTPAWRTLSSGVLRVGTYFNNPPFEFASHGQVEGFEIDLMRELARHLGLQIKFVITQWEDILREMEEKRYDCIVGGITITPGRRRMLAWSDPYMTTTLSLLVHASNAPASSKTIDLRRATVGV